jgi:hypothetical protein
MVPIFNPQGRAIQSQIEQLYENENLSSALTDPSAKILLGWAEKELSDYNGVDISAAELEEIANLLRRLVRYINVIIEKLPDLEEQELVQRLLYLAERAQEYEKVKVRKNDGEEHQEGNHGYD